MPVAQGSSPPAAQLPACWPPTGPYSLVAFPWRGEGAGVEPRMLGLPPGPAFPARSPPQGWVMLLWRDSGGWVPATPLDSDPAPQWIFFLGTRGRHCVPLCPCCVPCLQQGRHLMNTCCLRDAPCCQLSVGGCACPAVLSCGAQTLSHIPFDVSTHNVSSLVRRRHLENVLRGSCPSHPGDLTTPSSVASCRFFSQPCTWSLQHRELCLGPPLPPAPRLACAL